MGTTLVIVAVLAGLGAADAAAKEPLDNLLGVRLSMAQDDVHDRLEKRGELDKVKEGPGGAKEFWKLRDPRYGWLAIRYNGEKRVEWVTAFARDDKRGRRVRYKDIGDLDEARFSSSYIYTWVVQEKKGAEGYAITARGNNPDVLSSVSIYHATPPAH